MFAGMVSKIFLCQAVLILCVFPLLQTNDETGSMVCMNGTCFLSFDHSSCLHSSCADLSKGTFFLWP